MRVLLLLSPLPSERPALSGHCEVSVCVRFLCDFDAEGWAISVLCECVVVSF